MPCLRLKRQIKSSLPSNKHFLSWNDVELSECSCRMWKECEGNYSNTGMLHFTTLVFFPCSSALISIFFPVKPHFIFLFWVTKLVYFGPIRVTEWQIHILITSPNLELYGSFSKCWNFEIPENKAGLWFTLPPFEMY